MAPSVCQRSNHFAFPCYLSLHPLTPSHRPLGCYRGLEHKPECVTALLKTLKRIISELLTRPTSILLAKLWPQRPTVSTSTSGPFPHRASKEAPSAGPFSSTSLRLTPSQISGLNSDPSWHLSQPQIAVSVCLLKRLRASQVQGTLSLTTESSETGWTPTQNDM